MVNKKYKDTLFRIIFHDKKNLLSQRCYENVYRTGYSKRNLGKELEYYGRFTAGI